MSTFFESTGNYRSALYMWHHFLGIQERMFGTERKEMLSTYKKIGTLYSQVGNPASAAKFFEKAQEMIELAKNEAGLSLEAKNERLEEAGHIYFQQYLTAN